MLILKSTYWRGCVEDTKRQKMVIIAILIMKILHIHRTMMMTIT